MMLFLGIAFAAMGLDVLTKLLTSQLLGEKIVRLGWLIELRQTQNTGMAFGMLSGQWLANILMPLAVVFAGWMLMRRYRVTSFTAMSCGLVAGGFVGNFAQRLLLGYVLDMIYFPWLPFFVCNVADICICFGVALLAFSLLFRPQDWQEKTRSAKDAQN
ncbi:MAG: signal peptidase II [Clostridia bacterium]|nr:signal peptidase II [Clostridia bacterium]